MCVGVARVRAREPLCPRVRVCPRSQCEPGIGCVPGQSGNTSVYGGELHAIAQKIQAFAAGLPKKAAVVFGITTPFLCSSQTDHIVSGLNSEAAAIMKSLGVPTIDLHAAIVAKCGPAPITDCFGVQDCFCPHCPGAGYQYLANSTIAPALRALLA